jgi:UTP-glucose-1-phosphate uridylyltransferase/mevalonate kinase
MKLFVPGRICLFGEHSDWAGGYRRINSELEKGYTIITGTNQGVHAEVKPHSTKLILTSTLTDGSKEGPFEIEMRSDALLEQAQKGGFFSYACGVAYQVITHYHVRGLEIDNFLTDIPIQKGLSSSAAICVLVARAFNRVYDLKMTVRGEMEYAYQGEITTPSRCGRMDQGCAYGERPILMTFDGDRIDVQELKVKENLHFVIVDLKAGKDTKEILAKLNNCYPFADDEMQKKVQQYLGHINKQTVHEAIDALHEGNAKHVGDLMNRAQKEFDAHLQPACSSQLTAPVLHKVLQYKPIMKYIYGGKGVGSQGDGSAQLLAMNEESQQKVMQILKSDLGMPCLPLTIKTAQKIRKAVIPAAGFGTRLFPASKTIKKELFPIIDSTGTAKPVLLAIVEEALNSGIESISIIIQERDRELFEDFFYNLPFAENFNKLSREGQDYCNRIIDIGHRIHFVFQDVQEGFGHAVYCANKWVNDEPFILMLGDHLYISDNETPCTRQLLEVYEEYNTNVIGLKVISGSELKRFGCVTGQWEEINSILNVTEIYEKPSPEYAGEHLHMDTMKDDQYLALSGQYILTPKIFHFLEDNIESNIREKGEFQLTSCLDRLRQEDGFVGYVIEGRSFDIGVPEQYRRTLFEYSQVHKEYNENQQN